MSEEETPAKRRKSIDMKVENPKEESVNKLYEKIE